MIYIHTQLLRCLTSNSYELLHQSGRRGENYYERELKLTFILSDASPFKSGLLAIIGAVVLVLLILVIYLAWKIRKEKRFRKELAAAGLLYFKEGVTKSLNPDLGIDEQAELLPYDEKFEFSPDRLILGKNLCIYFIIRFFMI
jgi:hypothetical protein